MYKHHKEIKNSLGPAQTLIKKTNYLPLLNPQQITKNGEEKQGWFNRKSIFNPEHEARILQILSNDSSMVSFWQREPRCIAQIFSAPASTVLHGKPLLGCPQAPRGPPKLVDSPKWSEMCFPCPQHMLAISLKARDWTGRFLKLPVPHYEYERSSEPEFGSLLQNRLPSFSR